MNTPMRSFALSVIFAIGVVNFVAAQFTEGATPVQSQQWHSFDKTQLSEMFLSEGASFADFDRDGIQDVVSGPHIYFGPDSQDVIELYSAAPFDIQGYSDNFFAFPHDVNHDGWVDAFFVGFPGQDAYWLMNPGAEADESSKIAGGKLVRASNGWQRFLALQPVDNESPQFEDINNDGRPDLLCQSKDRLGWAEYSLESPQSSWTFHPVSATGTGGRFTHGLGAGDMNGDGRTLSGCVQFFSPK